LISETFFSLLFVEGRLRILLLLLLPQCKPLELRDWIGKVTLLSKDCVGFVAVVDVFCCCCCYRYRNLLLLLPHEEETSKMFVSFLILQLFPFAAAVASHKSRSSLDDVFAINRCGKIALSEG
jgi:hypothetical protein